MMRMLRRIGMPRSFLTALRRFYQMNRQRIRFRGAPTTEFLATAGVRQGCPLSPLIFAVVMDVLLRELAFRLPRATIRAFADDIGLAAPDIREAYTAFAIFTEFSKFSGLHLNLPKTVLVPLWFCSTSSVLRLLRDEYPELSKVEIAFAAKYLGIWIGPEAHLHQWDAALSKYRDRCARWAVSTLGLHLSVRVYNVFVLSVRLILTALGVCCVNSLLEVWPRSPTLHLWSGITREAIARPTP